MEHMVKKRNTRMGVALASTIDIDSDLHVGFFSGAGDGSGTGGKLEMGSWGFFCLHDVSLTGKGGLVATLGEI